MATVTGKAILADGTPLIGAVVELFPTRGPLFGADNRMTGRHKVTLAADANGQYVANILPGYYRVTIDRRDWFEISVPGDGSYLAKDIVLVGGVPALTGALRWFDSIEAMLEADSRTWIQGRTRNSYGTDGIVSGWDRVLVADDPTVTARANGDSILLTDDGFAAAVRTFIAG